MLCEYGCGREAQYQLKNSRWCCEKNYQACPINRKKNSESLMNSDRHTNRKLF